MKTIQIPDDVYRQAVELASIDNVSVDELVAAIVRESSREWESLKARAARGSLEKFNAVLSRVPDATPAPEDRL